MKKKISKIIGNLIGMIAYLSIIYVGIIGGFIIGKTFLAWPTVEGITNLHLLSVAILYPSIMLLCFGSYLSSKYMRDVFLDSKDQLTTFEKIFSFIFTLILVVSLIYSWIYIDWSLL